MRQNNHPYFTNDDNEAEWLSHMEIGEINQEDKIQT
jgi:hypothetical protein